MVYNLKDNEKKKKPVLRVVAPPPPISCLCLNSPVH